ncbi:hypothetical protein PLICRDRAFT_505252 [Plicaturopsis crispa FD-325 SS-3]|nr:hypothetical protein PLICRDRAFT_505252 [Plicaturopsis crispa FD-325 SS-3]
MVVGRETRRYKLAPDREVLGPYRTTTALVPPCDPLERPSMRPLLYMLGPIGRHRQLPSRLSLAMSCFVAISKSTVTKP